MPPFSALTVVGAVGVVVVAEDVAENVAEDVVAAAAAAAASVEMVGDVFLFAPIGRTVLELMLFWLYL